LGGWAYDFESGQALGYIDSLTAIKPQLIINLFLQTILLELLRGHGLFWVHAASVAEAGRAVLLVGQTGSGKTTTCLNLAEAGFNFLAQDRTLIRLRDQRIELLAFPEDLAVSEQSLDLLPSLRQRAGATEGRATKGRGTEPWTGKRQIDP